MKKNRENWFNIPPVPCTFSWKEQDGALYEAERSAAAVYEL